MSKLFLLYNYCILATKIIRWCWNICQHESVKDVTRWRADIWSGEQCHLCMRFFQYSCDATYISPHNFICNNYTAFYPCRWQLWEHGFCHNLSVLFPHNISKTSATSITKLDIKNFYNESRKYIYFGVKRPQVNCLLVATTVCSTLGVKKTIQWTFGHNFGKCWPIYKVPSLSESCGNFVHTRHEDSPPHLKYVSTLHCETWKLQLLPISMAYFMWYLIIHLVRYEASLIAQVWTLWL